MNIKTILKSSVAAAALVAIAAPAANAGIKNGNKNSLTVSGYVAKSLAYFDDGENDQLFITDGSTSESRVRWIASGKLNENVTAGAGIEMEIPLSNPQNNATLGANGEGGADRTAWQIRHQFVWVSHKKFGKISLGQTNAAANGASEANLTGTSSIDLSSGKPFGQGLVFIDKTAAAASRSTVSVGAAFSNFDMTSRTDVIRYDAPKFMGVSLAASLNNGGGGEVGAKYSGKFGGVKILAKAGYTNTSATSTTVDDRRAFSIGLLHDSGINVSFAIAEQNLTSPTAGQDDPSMIYGSVGYKAKIFGVGGTNFNIRYQQTDDLQAQGSEATSFGVTVVQNFDTIGAQIGINYQNYAYETATFSNYEDVDTLALQAIFNF